MRRTLLAVLVLIFATSDTKRNNRSSYLRNYYKSYDDHEHQVAKVLNLEDGSQVFGLVDDGHRTRHRHGDASDKKKIRNLDRCRRYAKAYYNNAAPTVVRSNCYYQAPRCVQNYCGYCPTSSCRRRCPQANYCQYYTPTPPVSVIIQPTQPSCINK